MYKHPISATLRMLPAVLWVCAFAACIWALAQLYSVSLTPDKWQQAQKLWLELVFLGGFIALAAYCVRMAYREYQEALPAIRADRPLLPPRRPKPVYVATRHPLPEQQRIQLQTALATLIATGVLRADEITFQQLVDCAEIADDYSQQDCSEAYVIFHLLSHLRSENGREFHNLAFIEDQVEVETNTVLEIVREFARLAGRTEPLLALKLKGIEGDDVVLARRGEFPPPNAVVEFQLGARQCAVPFVMYGKNCPIGLMETLPEIMTPVDQPRCFFSSYFDSFLLVTFLSPDQVATLNLAFAHQPDCFELLK